MINSYSKMIALEERIVLDAAAAAEFVAQADGSSPSNNATDVVFIDSNVEDKETLKDAINSDADIYYLDPSEDALAQMTNILSNYQNLQDIHIISHGQTDKIQLGDISLTLDTIQNHKNTFEIWGQSLSEDGNLRFYGCNSAETIQGQLMLSSIAEWSSADVAASTDITGQLIQNGDWDLEYSVGVIENSSVEHDFNESNYSYILAVNTAPILDNSGSPFIDGVTFDETDPQGNTISEIYARGAGGNPVTDPDPGALRGMAIFQVDNANGQWQYSTDSGTNWNDLTGITSANALVLSDDGNNRIRFVPNNGFEGNAEFLFRAWDRTGGSTSGDFVNIAATGGMTAFSVNHGGVDITVTAPSRGGDTISGLNQLPTNSNLFDTSGTSSSSSTDLLDDIDFSDRVITSENFSSNIAFNSNQTFSSTSPFGPQNVIGLQNTDAFAYENIFNSDLLNTDTSDTEDDEEEEQTDQNNEPTQDDETGERDFLNPIQPELYAASDTTIMDQYNSKNFQQQFENHLKESEQRTLISYVSSQKLSLS